MSVRPSRCASFRARNRLCRSRAGCACALRIDARIVPMRWNGPFEKSIERDVGRRKERLGRHHDERLAKLAQDLPPSTWKNCAGVVGLARPGCCPRRRAARKRSKRARVLRPLALVAVRQEQTRPLRAATCLRRDDELVDDDLRAVDEVAELGLPHHQHVGLVERVAELEAEHRRLREQASRRCERRLVLATCARAARTPAPCVCRPGPRGAG